MKWYPFVLCIPLSDKRHFATRRDSLGGSNAKSNSRPALQCRFGCHVLTISVSAECPCVSLVDSWQREASAINKGHSDALDSPRSERCTPHHPKTLLHREFRRGSSCHHQRSVCLQPQRQWPLSQVGVLSRADQTVVSEGRPLSKTEITEWQALLSLVSPTKCECRLGIIHR